MSLCWRVVYCDCQFIDASCLTLHISNISIIGITIAWDVNSNDIGIDNDNNIENDNHSHMRMISIFKCKSKSKWEWFALGSGGKLGLYRKRGVYPHCYIFFKFGGIAWLFIVHLIWGVDYIIPPSDTNSEYFPFTIVGFWEPNTVLKVEFGLPTQRVFKAK